MLEFEIQAPETALLAILVGLVLLIGSGELLVRGSVALAKQLGIPSFPNHHRKVFYFHTYSE